MRYAVELTAWSGTHGALRTLYLATHSFVTSHLDTPAHTEFRPWLLDPGDFERHLLAPGSVLEPGDSSWGTITLANLAGQLDGLISAVDGRRIIIRRTTRQHARYPDEWELVGDQIGARVEHAGDVIRIIARDRRAQIAARPMAPERFAGDNELPAGLEGSESLKGRPKPVAVGVARVCPVPRVNRSVHIYQLSTPPFTPVTVSHAYTFGSDLALGVVRPSLAALEATQPAPDTYDYFPGSATQGAYLRTSTEVADLTVDLLEGVVPADRQIVPMIRRILTGPGGVDPADIDEASFDAVAAQVPWQAGLWVDDETTVGAALDTLCRSAGGVGWIQRRDGRIALARLAPPTGNPVAELTPSMRPADKGIEILGLSDTEDGLPPWRVAADYQPIHRVYSASDIFDRVHVSDARFDRLTQETLRTGWWEDVARQIRNPDAGELILSSALDQEADAIALRDHIAGLLAPGRLLLRVPMVMSAVPAAVDIGAEVSVVWHRHGMDQGRPMIVIGLIERHGAGRVDAYVWG